MAARAGAGRSRAARRDAVAQALRAARRSRRPRGGIHDRRRAPHAAARFRGRLDGDARDRRRHDPRPSSCEPPRADRGNRDRDRSRAAPRRRTISRSRSWTTGRSRSRRRARPRAATRSCAAGARAGGRRFARVPSRSCPTAPRRTRFARSCTNALARSPTTPRDSSPTAIPNGSTRCASARGACARACRSSRRSPGSACVGPVVAEIRWLAGVLGAARDWDVLAVETMPPLAAALAQDPAAARRLEATRPQHRRAPARGAQRRTRGRALAALPAAAAHDRRTLRAAGIRR